MNRSTLLKSALATAAGLLLKETVLPQTPRVLAAAQVGPDPLPRDELWRDLAYGLATNNHALIAQVQRRSGMRSERRYLPRFHGADFMFPTVLWRQGIPHPNMASDYLGASLSPFAPGMRAHRSVIVPVHWPLIEDEDPTLGQMLSMSLWYGLLASLTTLGARVVTEEPMSISASYQSVWNDRGEMRMAYAENVVLYRLGYRAEGLPR